MRCLNIARKEGVLALEELVHENDNYFFKAIMMLVVDGTDPELVKEIAEILMNSENHTGSALLERILITVGVLSVQAGENPRIAEVKLFSYLGEAYLKERGHGTNAIVHEPAILKLEEVVGETPLPECAVFDSGLQTMENKDIQTVIKEVDTRTLAIALKGCGNAVAKIVGSNLSQRLESMIAEDIEYMGDKDINEILEEQDKIAAAAKQLAKTGAIRLTKGAFDKIVLRVVKKED
jgi:hypothetical protein